MHSENINHLFRCRKTLTSVWFLRTSMKTSYSVSSHDSYMQLLQPTCESPYCWGGIRLWRLVFLISLSYFAVTICLVFPKKQVTICLEALRGRTTFAGLIFKYPYSRRLFIFGLISINLGFNTYHDVKEVFRSIATVFFTYFSSNRHEPFFERWTNFIGAKVSTFCLQ